MSEEPEDGPSEVIVDCHFVRDRNVLLCAADCGPMLLDFYLHLGRRGLVLEQGVDGELKLLLIALVLHAASRPRGFTGAWTVHFEDPALNLFAVVEGPTGRVVGQAFDRDVRSLGGNVLHAETADETGARRRSSVQFAGGGVLAGVTAFYRMSEQRPVRFVDLGGDDFALLVAQPDGDVEWLEAVAPAQIREWLAAVERPPLERRHFRFECGCTPARIAEVIGPALQGELEAMFDPEGRMVVGCPRCGERHELSRVDFRRREG